VYGGDGCIIDSNTLTNIGYNGITTFKSKNQIISNNTLTNIPNRQGGIRYDYGAGSNSIIRGNKFYNNAGIQLYPDSNNITIENNIFQGDKEIQIECGMGHKIINNTFGAGAARLELIGLSGNSLTNVLVKGNRFENSSGLRLGMEVHNITISENLFINNPGSGILKSTVNTGSQSNISILNNVFYNNGADDISFTGGTVDSVTVRNNIFMGGMGYAVYRSVGTNFTASYNDVYGNSNTYASGVTTSQNIAGDPLFVNSTAGDFHLKSPYGRWNGTSWVTTDTQLSPCIGAGDPSLDNSQSPWGGIIEMGAYGNTEESSSPGNVDTGSISGVVIDTNSIPLSGAALYTVGFSALTGDDGSYILTGIPVGNRQVRASKTGYATQTKQAVVVKDGTAGLDFSLVVSTAVTIDNEPPSVAITSPADGSAAAPLISRSAAQPRTTRNYPGLR